MSSLRQRLGGIGRWPRLAAAAACLLLAGVSALESSAAKPRAASGRVVVVAARALPAGHTLTARDLTTTRPTGVVPGATAVPRRLVGRSLAGPLARGEPITVLRLLDGGLTTGLAPGTVAMPVDVTTDVRGLVSPGSRVDLLAVAAGDPATDAGAGGSASAPGSASASGSGAAQRLAARVLVLAALPPDSSAGTSGCRLVLALDRDAALRIAGARSARLFQVAALPP